MAWPELVFVGEFEHIVNRLAHLRDFDPYDLAVFTYKPEDAPAVLPPSTVALVVDRHDLRERYTGVPVLCHFRLTGHLRDLGKWSITIDGLGMDRHLDSLEGGSSHVSDDHEARQFCLLFLLAAIEHSLRSETPGLSEDERHRVITFNDAMSRSLDTRTFPDDAAHAVRLSIESMRLELDNPVLDSEIVRRCLQRIERQFAEVDAASDPGGLGGQLSDLIRVMRAPGR